jgi:DNA repair photolyase
LTDAGVPVGVMVAPIIPGLNDSEIPAILAAAAEAGALRAGYVMLRLPLMVEPVFFEWLERTQGDRKAAIEGAIRSVRGGALSQSKFGERLRGTGARAEQIGQMFRTFVKKHGLDRKLPEYDLTQFRPPGEDDGQLRLF